MVKHIPHKDREWLFDAASAHHIEKMMTPKRRFLDKLEGCPEWDRRLLNPKLVEKNELTEEDIQAIVNLHNDRLHLWHRLNKLDPTTPEGRAELREGVQLTENIEFDLQKAWKFPQSRSHHTWWYQIPHCQCPYYDNRDSFGTDVRYIKPSCPAHGDKQ